MDALDRKLQEHLGDGYALQQELVGGGMSRVFVVEEKALGRRVVIKVLHPALAATVSAARFQREILLAAAMNHPNIVPVLSAGEVEGLPYFIMPFVEGESLRARIMRGPLSVRETLAVLKDVARALAYAHNAGVVHRDIKPGNILMTGSAAVVADFGVAKAVSASRDRGIISGGGTAITGIGISLGTPQYMAPEQAAADPSADHRVDIYALGIVAYEMLTGSPPFHGRTPQALLTAQLTELPTPIASRRYDVPVGLANLVMQALEKNPQDRPRTAMDVVRILESPETISGPVAETPRAVRTRRLRWVKSTAYGVLLAAVAISATVWGLRSPDATDGATGTPATTPAADSTPPGGAPVSVVVDQAIGTGSADVATGIVAALVPSLSSAGSTVTTGGAVTDSSGLVVGVTVQRQGARIRATLRLARGRSTTALWSDRFDFAVDDAFAAQDSMAARTVRALRAAR